MKDIPIPSKNAYLKNLIFKLEIFIKRIRWKAYFFDKPNNIDDVIAVNNFGFKSVLTPPKYIHLHAFEEDLYDLVRSIGFKGANTVFQNQLNKDIIMINKVSHCYLFLQTSLTTFKKLVKTPIANYCMIKAYKKPNVVLINNVNKEANGA